MASSPSTASLCRLPLVAASLGRGAVCLWVAGCRLPLVAASLDGAGGWLACCFLAARSLVGSLLSWLAGCWLCSGCLQGSQPGSLLSLAGSLLSWLAGCWLSSGWVLFLAGGCLAGCLAGWLVLPCAPALLWLACLAGCLLCSQRLLLESREPVLQSLEALLRLRVVRGGGPSPLYSLRRDSAQWRQ